MSADAPSDCSAPAASWFAARARACHSDEAVRVRENVAQVQVRGGDVAVRLGGASRELVGGIFWFNFPGGSGKPVRSEMSNVLRRMMRDLPDPLGRAHLARRR